jgi:hypothetical protein
MPRNSSLTKRIVGIVIAVVLVPVLPWLILRVRATSGRTLFAEVLSVTNAPSGTRYASLRLGNQGRLEVMLLPTYAMQNRLGVWKTNLLPINALAQGTNLMGVLPFHPRVKSLKKGEFYEVTLSLPFDDPDWQGLFWYVESPPPLEDAARSWARRFGLRRSESNQAIISTGWRHDESGGGDRSR